MSSCKRLRCDVEGELVEIAGSPQARYAKRLSAAVGWHFLRPEDLPFLLEDLVAEVVSDHDAQVLDIRYPAGIEPLDLQGLRDRLALDRPHAAWRLARTLLDLAGSLRSFHQAGVPQGVVHPERVARHGAGFVFLPTLAGTLPPLPALPPNSAAGWLHFIAPEVLRTRSNLFALLPKGDVYALGRLAAVLAAPDWEPLEAASVPELAEQLVEGESEPPAARWPAGAEPLAALVARMCARLPEERIELDLVVDELRTLVAQSEPQAAIRKRIAEGDLKAARRDLDALSQAPSCSVFTVARSLLLDLEAELALAATPPSFPAAIDLLTKAIDLDPESADLHRRLGATYARFCDHPQHLMLSAQAYKRAARRLEWRKDIMDEWLAVLRRVGNPVEKLSQTSRLPREALGPDVFLLRAGSYLEVGKTELAWQECMFWTRCLPDDGRIPGIAREVAKQSARPELLEWLVLHREEPALAQLRAVIWAEVGNPQQAAECLAEAQSYAARIEEEKS